MIGTSTSSDLARRHTGSAEPIPTPSTECALHSHPTAGGIREAEGNGEEADVTGIGTEIHHDATYRHAALVDLDAHANATPPRPTSRRMNAATSVCRLTAPSGPWPDSREWFEGARPAETVTA